MIKLTQAQAAAIAARDGLKAVVSGNKIYIVAVLCTVDQVGTKALPLPSVMPELLQPYDPNVAFQCGNRMTAAIRGEQP